MSNESDDGAAPARPCGARLWVDKGLFHAEVGHPAFGWQLRVVLHGVRTYEEARKAVVVLSGQKVKERAEQGPRAGG